MGEKPLNATSTSIHPTLPHFFLLPYFLLISTTSKGPSSSSTTCPGFNASVYILSTSWGWKIPGLVHERMACFPGGSVRRKHPQLRIKRSAYFSPHPLKKERKKEKGRSREEKINGKRKKVLPPLPRRHHNRHTLPHHNLIPHLRMQIPTTHEAPLRRMRVDPPQHHDILLFTILEKLHLPLIRHLTRIARRRLRRYHQPRDEQRVRL